MLRAEPLITTCCGKLTAVELVTRKPAGPTAAKKLKPGPENEFGEDEKKVMPCGWLANAVGEAVTTICPGEPGEAVKLVVELTPGGNELQQTWKIFTVPLKP